MKKEELISFLVKEMQELEISIYNRSLPHEEQVSTWEDVDEEVLMRMTDLDQDCDEIANLDPFWDVPGHNWDCGEWYAYRTILNKIK